MIKQHTFFVKRLLLGDQDVVRSSSRILHLLGASTRPKYMVSV